jgi:cytochrome c oxidase cbb3-type subunit III
LRSVVQSNTSLMPHNYDKELTAEEYQDLLAMLSRQVTLHLHNKVEGEGEVGR